MIYPTFLKDGDRIGYVAPSFGAVMEPYATRFKAAADNFDAMGYANVVGANVYKDDGIGKSTTARACAEEINDFFINDRSDIILSVGGGETMCEDLNFIDFTGIARAAASGNAKWYMGYSDNTNLTFPLATICDIASIYGPCAPSFGMEIWHESLKDAYAFLRGEKHSFTNYEGFELPDEQTEEEYAANPLKPYIINTPASLDIHLPGYPQLPLYDISFSGRMIGGCLDCLTALCGTKFDAVAQRNKYFGVDAFADRYADDGIIWYIESCELSPIGVLRALWQLDAAGWFKNVNGFIIGRPMTYGQEAFGLDHKKAVASVLDKYHVPIIFNADIGHIPPAMPIVNGAMAEISFKKDINTTQLNYNVLTK